MTKNKNSKMKKSKLNTAANKEKSKVFEYKVTAKSVSGAIEKGLLELGVDKNQVEIKILKPAKNFQSAQILICGQKSILPNPDIVLQIEKTEPSQTTEDLTDAQFAKKFCLGLFEVAKCTTFDADVREDDQTITLQLNGKSLQKFVGPNGRVLASVQNLVNAALQSHNPSAKHVVVDINGFKAKRAQKIEQLALQSAQKALDLGQEIALEPMNAFERRIVHNAVAKFEQLETQSAGEQPNRFVVIKLKK